jgi:hypothetical protein
MGKGTFRSELAFAHFPISTDFCFKLLLEIRRGCTDLPSPHRFNLRSVISILRIVNLVLSNLARFVPIRMIVLRMKSCRSWSCCSFLFFELKKILTTNLRWKRCNFDIHWSFILVIDIEITFLIKIFRVFHALFRDIIHISHHYRWKFWIKWILSYTWVVNRFARTKQWSIIINLLLGLHLKIVELIVKLLYTKSKAMEPLALMLLVLSKHAVHAT